MLYCRVLIIHSYSTRPPAVSKRKIGLEACVAGQIVRSAQHEVSEFHTAPAPALFAARPLLGVCAPQRGITSCGQDDRRAARRSRPAGAPTREPDPPRAGGPARRAPRTHPRPLRLRGRRAEGRGCCGFGSRPKRIQPSPSAVRPTYAYRLMRNLRYCGSVASSRPAS